MINVQRVFKEEVNVKKCLFRKEMREHGGNNSNTDSGDKTFLSDRRLLQIYLFAESIFSSWGDKALPQVT